MLLIAHAALAEILRAAEDIVRRTACVDVHLCHGCEVGRIHAGHTSLIMQLVALIVGADTVSHPVPCGEHLQRVLNGQAVGVCLLAPEEHDVVKVGGIHAIILGVRHVDAHALAVGLDSRGSRCCRQDSLGTNIAVGSQHHGAVAHGAGVSLIKQQRHHGGAILIVGLDDKAGIDAAMGGGQVPFKMIDRQVKHQHVNQHAAAGADIRLVGIDHQVDQTQHVIHVVSLSQPFAEAEALTPVQPAAQEGGGMGVMLSAGHAIVGEHHVRIHLPHQIFGAVIQDLMILGEEAGVHIAGLVQPILEMNQTLFNLLCLLLIQARSAMLAQHTDQRGDGEISAVQAGVDARKRLVNGEVSNRRRVDPGLLQLHLRQIVIQAQEAVERAKRAGHFLGRGCSLDLSKLHDMFQILQVVHVIIPRFHDIHPPSRRLWYCLRRDASDTRRGSIPYTV